MTSVLAVLTAVAFLAAAVAPGLSRRANPAVATIVLTVSALALSMAFGFVLCLLGYVGLIEVAPVAHPDDWTPRGLRESIPLPTSVSLLAGAVGLVFFCGAVLRALTFARRARHVSSAARALPAVGDLAVVEDDAFHAYAVPGGLGRRGRVVVSRALLRSLSAPERKALLAHERAHLDLRHHVFVQLAELSAAANPLSRPLAAAVSRAVERWADAAAVRAVGDRVVVARALAVAALHGTSPPPDALHAARADVVERVEQLLRPVRNRRAATTAVVAVAFVSWVCAVVAVAQLHQLIDLAELART